MGRLERRLSASQFIVLGFASVITIGCLLLMLPFATKDGQGASFLDGLFTATSAVCVTGLIVRDTATYWSVFGQLIILLLIQIGGMGVVTIAVSLTVLSGRRTSLKERAIMQEAISAPHVGGIVRLAGFIVRMSLLVEGIGALVLFPVFYRVFGVGRGIWASIFHSISAYCNAGFDVMGVQEPYSSLTAFYGHPVVNLVIMTLIVSGGLGFLTWDDILVHRLHVRRYRVQSKIILIATPMFILLPALYFFFGEFSGAAFMPRVWMSFFQSVTTRTAGFNTADLSRLSEPGLGLMTFLMLVGASPGSTAGGMKTTTFAVAACTMISVFRRDGSAHFFGRRVGYETTRNAMAVLVMYVSLFMAGGFVLSRMEGLPLLTCLFETASAIGTVGLTLGITPALGRGSRVLLMGLMFLGRVGGLTIIFSTVAVNSHKTAKLPKEHVTVG